MTLPTSGSISTDQILTELRVANASRNLPLSLDDTDVLALTSKSAPPVTMPDDFYGKSATPPTQPAQPMALYPSGSDNYRSTTSGGGTIAINLSVAVTGGASPLTYLWTNIMSAGGMTQVTGNNGPSLNFERTYAENSSGSASASAVCTVTDANGVSKSTGTVSGTATWGTPA